MSNFRLMTDKELKEMVASLASTQKETDRLMKETDQQIKRTDRQIKELGKQIGGLGNKFGDFAEGMAIPSLMEILSKRFGAEQIIETRRVRKGEDEIEIDLIGTTNGHSKTVVAAEVKSVLNQRELEKFLRNLRRFYEFFPQFKGYKLYGVLAAVDSSRETEAATIAEGICLARIHGDVFRLKVPAHFRPKDFSS